MIAKQEQNTTTASLSHVAFRYHVRLAVKWGLVIVGVVDLCWYVFFDPMVIKRDHGEVARKGEVEFVIPRMPYVCAIYMQFIPTNIIEKVKTMDITVSVFDKRNNLVLSDVVEGSHIYGETWGGKQYSGGNALIFRLVEDKSNVKLNKKYRILLTMSGSQTNDFEKINVFSECYY